MSIKRSLITGAASAMLALGLLGAAVPSARAADNGQDSWWYNNNHASWQGATDWRDNGVRVISGKDLDTNTPQTPGMSRKAAISAIDAPGHKGSAPEPGGSSLFIWRCRE